MGVMNSGMEALIVQYSDIKYIGYSLELEDTAKKLCNTRTFISTSYKWFTLGITLELLHIDLHSFYRFLELVNIALNNFK